MTMETTSPSYERAAFEKVIVDTLTHDIATHVCLARQTSQRCFALIDAGQCGPLDEQRQDADAIARLVVSHQLEATPLFFQTPEAPVASAGPWLIELPVANNGDIAMDVLVDLVRTAGLVHALSLVVSPLRPFALITHLRSWLDAVIPPDPTIPGDEAAGAVLRWYDPRVGFDMVACWPQAQQNDFLRAFSWAGWDAGFNPRGLRCSQLRSPQCAVREQPLVLNKDFLLAMTPLSQADDLLADVLERADASTFDPIAPALRRWVALDQVEQARQLDIDDHDSKITLLHHALSLHPGLSRLPGLKERLAEEARSGGVLAHVLDAQPERWWREHREAAAGVWAQWAHHFLMPLQARLAAGGMAHPFTALLPATLHPA